MCLQIFSINIFLKSFYLPQFIGEQNSILTVEGAGIDETEDDSSESFSFALLNGALGVFEVNGRRIRDFR